MVVNKSEWIVPTVDPGFGLCSNYTAAWLWLSNLQPAYMGLVSVVGVVGNSLVLYVFCLQKKPCTVADIYLGNLAAADLVMLSCLPFWAVTIAHSYQWAFGQALCKLLNVAISMNYYCSILFLVLVSMDRYLALVRPMTPSRLRRAAWAKRICLGIWLLGFLLSLPILLYRKVTYVENPGIYACILEYPHPGWRIQRNITLNILGFLVPVAVVTFCSCHIVAALSEGRASGVSRMRAERKATHLVLAVLAFFLFCWTPHQVMRFLDTLDYFQLTPWCLWGHILDICTQLSTYLAYSNGAANPFLFVIVGKHFRKRAKDVFGKNLRPCLKDKAYLTIKFTSLNKSNDTQRVSSDQPKQPQKQTAT